MRIILCALILLSACQKKKAATAGGVDGPDQPIGPTFDERMAQCAAPEFGSRVVVLLKKTGMNIDAQCMAFAHSAEGALTTDACRKVFESIAPEERAALIHTGSRWVVRQLAGFKDAPKDFRNGWIMGPGSIDVSLLTWDKAVEEFDNVGEGDLGQVQWDGRMKAFKVLGVTIGAAACPGLTLSEERKNSSPFALNLPLKIADRDMAVEFLSFHDACRSVPGNLLLGKDAAGLFKPLGLYSRPYMFYEADCSKQTEGIFTSLTTAVAYAKEAWHAL